MFANLINSNTYTYGLLFRKTKHRKCERSFLHISTTRFVLIKFRNESHFELIFALFKRNFEFLISLSVSSNVACDIEKWHLLSVHPRLLCNKYTILGPNTYIFWRQEKKEYLVEKKKALIQKLFKLVTCYSAV